MLINGVSSVDGDVENTLRKINGFLVMSLFHLKRVDPKSEAHSTLFIIRLVNSKTLATVYMTNQS